MRFNIFTILFFFSFSLLAQENIPLQSLKQAWDKNFQNAKDIKEVYKQHVHAKNSAERLTWNKCFMILKSGEYITRYKGVKQDTKFLVRQIPQINLNDSSVISFLQTQHPGRFADYYYMIRALKKGETFDAARDGISISTQLPARPLNHNDFAKLKDIFSSKNSLLHDTFLEKMKFLFQNNGCPTEIAALRSIIESHVEDSPLKQEILKLYTLYEVLSKGKPTPLSSLKDSEGKTYTFADFKDKVIVADIWATWCCSCIEKMPKFIQLRNEFKNSDKVLFLTISIDRQSAYNKWLKAIKENHMTGMLNLVASPEDSSFISDYQVVGVPRYLIIDKKGKIVSVFAPGPGKEMKELIQNALKQ